MWPFNTGDRGGSDETGGETGKITESDAEYDDGTLTCLRCGTRNWDLMTSRSSGSRSMRCTNCGFYAPIADGVLIHDD